MNDIIEFLPTYPSVNQPDFYQSLIEKKEFFENRLSQYENIPENPGDLFKHQQFMKKFLSSNTPYDQILLFHGLGTGKTCTAVATVEQIKSEGSNFKGALILSRKTLIANFQSELVLKCTAGQYIPDNYDNMSPENKKKKIAKKAEKEYYTFERFGQFANKLRVMTDEDIVQKYSNMVIVIDEVHNLRPQERKNKSIYEVIHKFLHLVHNCKILLLTGTPMKDKVEEIASVMNLILPLNEQFQNKKPDEFVNKYFVKDKTTYVYGIKNQEMLKELKSKLKGRISVLKSQDSNLDKRFVKNSVIEDNSLQTFVVYETEMSDFQYNVYTEALKKDMKTKGVINDDNPIIEEEHEDIEDIEENEEKEEAEENDDDDDEKSGYNSQEDEEVEVTKPKKSVYVLTKNEIQTELGIMKIIDVKPDGDCLFESIRRQIDTDDTIMEMRHKSCAQLRVDYNNLDKQAVIISSLQDWYREHYLDDDTENEEDDEFMSDPNQLLELYINIMETEPVDRDQDIGELYWGGELEIAILSKMYKTEICIVTQGNEKVHCPGVDDTLRKIFVFKTPTHYDILEPKQFPDGAEIQLGVDEKPGFFHQSRQAAMFVFPNGEYGTRGFSSNVIKTGKNSYKLKDEFYKMIKHSDQEIMLQRIHNFSSKFAQGIRQILNAVSHPTNKKKVFIYNEYTTAGGGTVLFSLLLNLFGFTKATGYEREGDKSKRYIVTTLVEGDLNH